MTPTTTRRVRWPAGWLRLARHLYLDHRLALQSTDWHRVVTCETCGRRWEWTA